MATAFIECVAPEAAHPGFGCAHPVTEDGDEEFEEDFDPDEDGSIALNRYLEGGWHGGQLDDEPWWAK